MLRTTSNFSSLPFEYFLDTDHCLRRKICTFLWLVLSSSSDKMKGYLLYAARQKKIILITRRQLLKTYYIFITQTMDYVKEYTPVRVLNYCHNAL